MATNKPSRGIGPVPEGLSEGLTDFLTQMRKQTLDVLAGRTAVGGSGSSSGAGGSTIIIGGGGSGGSVEPDLTPPPTPTGVNVVAGIDFVGVTTDAPVFSQGHGYLATLVYGKKYAGTGPLPTYSDDSKQFEFTGEVGTFPTDPATQWHIWVKWKTKDGVVSLSPAGGTNGFQVTTGQDVTKLLAALNNKIRNEQLDPTSNFIYRVNSFTIAPPAGTTGVANILPFSVLTVPTLTAGGELLPAGVYMEAAFIKNLDVALGRFQNAFITNAMIVSVSASRITSGVISVGNYIQSSSYVPGTSGWRIHGDGSAEFAAASIRGQLTAAQINGNGLRIGSADGTKTIVDPTAAKPIDNSMVNPAAGWLNSNVGLPRGQALSVNPECNLPAEWNPSGSGSIAFVSGVVGVPYQTGVGNSAGIGGQTLISKTPTPIDPTRRLRVSAFAYSNNGTGNAYLGIAWLDKTGAAIDSSIAVPAGWNNGTYSYFGLVNQTPPAAGQRYTQEFGAGVSGVAIPSNAVAALLVYLPNYSGTAGARHYVTDFKIEDITDVAYAGTIANWSGVSGSGKPLDNASKVIDLGEGTNPGQRGANDPPSFYSTGVTRQFKVSAAVGLGGADNYLTLETVIQYVDGSGGSCYQYAYRGTTTWRRWGTCGANSWAGAWAQDLDRNAYTGDLDATKGAPSGTFVGGTLAEVVRDGAASGSSAYDAITNASTGLNSRLLNGANNVLAYGSRIIAGNLSLSGSGAYQGGGGVAITQGGIFGVRSGGFVTFAINASDGSAVFGGELSAAYGTLGSLTIANGGFVRAGQSAWATGTGFFMGLDASGNPSFSVGDGTSFMRWSVAYGLEVKQAGIILSLTGGGAISHHPSSPGTYSIGTRTANIVSGGIGPYTFAWSVNDLGSYEAAIYISGADDAATVALKSRIDTLSGLAAAKIRCTVTDANGRSAYISFNAVSQGPNA